MKCSSWLFKYSVSWNRVEESMMWFLLLLSCTITAAEQLSESPGCNLFNATINVSIPNCVEFPHTAHGCRGYCESYATTTNASELWLNPHQVITSRSSCCNMDETQYSTVDVLCLTGIRRVTLKVAKSCSCSACKKN